MAPFYPSPIAAQPDGNPYEDYKSGRKTLEQINEEYARIWPRCEEHGAVAHCFWQDRPICERCAEAIFTKTPTRVQRS